CPEKNKPTGAKCVGTDREKLVKPHTPNGLWNKNSKSNGTRTSVKPIENLDFNSSTFEVGESSKQKPNKSSKSPKPNVSNSFPKKGGNSISAKPSSNSHHASNADGRRKDGGRNVKPPGSDQSRSFSAFPKRRSPGRAGLGYAPPSVGFNSNMSVNH